MILTKESTKTYLHKKKLFLYGILYYQMTPQDYLRSSDYQFAGVYPHDPLPYSETAKTTTGDAMLRNIMDKLPMQPKKLLS